MVSWKHLFPTLVVVFPCHCSAFLTRPPGSRGIGSVPPHQHAQNRQPDWEDSEPVQAFLGNLTDRTLETAADGVVVMRGGSSSFQRRNDHVAGNKITLASTKSYWSDAFSKAGKTITSPFRAVKEKISSAMESDQQKAEKELLEALKTMKVQTVALPNSTVVPREVINLAARRSGLIGNPLRTDRVQEFAKSLKRWYEMRGYVLHEVTGATLRTESATAEIQVQEPQVSQRPVDIVFCKEMVVDEETGNLMTFRQYKERHLKRRTIGSRDITKKDTNTTFIQTTGKTRPNCIAQVLGLKAGQHFQWDSNRWNMIRRSGIFGRILSAGPKRLQDGSVQLQIMATEAPARHLEYGVSKSLYTGSWEGEVDFQHENLFGAGESLGLMVRRGTKDPEPSVRLRYSDDKFGMPHGYDIEAFSDFIGDDDKDGPTTKKAKEEKGAKKEEEKKKTEKKPKDPDRMLDRRGIKFTYRNPIDPQRIQFSTASTSLERTATQCGKREAIGYGTLALGPFRRQLPLDARSSVDGSLTTGVRVPEGGAAATEEARTTYRGITLLPYSSFTLTTTQILPLQADAGWRQQPCLALRHSLCGSTRNLPRHEQNAMGFSSIIRGGTPNGRISTSLNGSTELRIPLESDAIPALKRFQRDASVVLFGDWVSTRKSNGSSFAFEKSIGVGLRKTTQGIPLKLDFSYAGNGKIKSNFGLGRDFDV